MKNGVARLEKDRSNSDLILSVRHNVRFILLRFLSRYKFILSIVGVYPIAIFSTDYFLLVNFTGRDNITILW